MDSLEFKKIFKEDLTKINLLYDDERAKQLYKYMDSLLEWNKKINLTAIIEPKDIILKHFVDSLTIEKFIQNKAKMIDVGTGAGLPGIPIAIYRPDVNVTLLDSLNKRIKFLEDVKNTESLENINIITGRAEDIGKDKKFREQYDIAVARAVAPLNVLVEYLLPFVKIGGICICMKGPNVEEELKNINSALSVLGGNIQEEVTFKLEDDMNRNIIIIKKNRATPGLYPRKAGIPSKKPII